MPTPTHIAKIKPMISLFSSEALEKAKKMNEDVSMKLASIRDSHEEILRPKNLSSYSSRQKSRQSDFSESSMIRNYDNDKK